MLGLGGPRQGPRLMSPKASGLGNLTRRPWIIETLEQFGLPIWVTEFDWSGNSNDHKEHAVQLENFYRLMFSLPQVGRSSLAKGG